MIVPINKTAPSRFVTEDERIRELRKNVTKRYDTPLEASALFAGRYRKIDELGGGGMGIVYLMEDTLMDDEQFAIKMLPPYLSDDEDALALIAREAKNAQKLHHPHIVCVRHYAKYNRTPYIVMDYIAGTTVRRQLSYGPIPEEMVIALLKPIADALDYAHRPMGNRGVVLHRDIKPDNIIFQQYDDGTLHPVILDFGISKVTEDVASMTRFRRTPGYTPPEKMLDAKCVSTVAHDIFSFAVTAYECLTGNLPFGQEEDAATLERIKQADFEKINSSSAFARAVERGLAFRPEDRPKTCAEFFAEMGTAAPVIQTHAPEPAQATPIQAESVMAAPEPMPTVDAPPAPPSPKANPPCPAIVVPAHTPEYIAKTVIVTAICSDYRVMLAESATLHRENPDVADRLRSIQALLRDAFEADDESVDAFVLRYLFDCVTQLHKDFTKNHRGPLFFMEHRRRNVARKIVNMPEEPWCMALKKSIII